MRGDVKMNIHINGEGKEISQNTNVRDLLIFLDIDPLQSGIAVAVDRVVIPKSKWKEFEVTENSEIEIIRAVQGG